MEGSGVQPKKGRRLLVAALAIIIAGSAIVFFTLLRDKSTGSSLKSGNPRATGQGNKESTDDVVVAQPLTEGDFAVTDNEGKNHIYLDAPFSTFMTDKRENKVENNFVGFVNDGEYEYKYYIHKYDGFDIYVSNANYQKKGRSFDEYYISQITLKSSDFRTPRGITIGSKMDDVVKLYGQGQRVVGNNNTVTLTYRTRDMEIGFSFDQQQKVKEITINLAVGNRS